MAKFTLTKGRCGFGKIQSFDCVVLRPIGCFLDTPEVHKLIHEMGGETPQFNYAGALIIVDDRDDFIAKFGEALTRLLNPVAPFGSSPFSFLFQPIARLLEWLGLAGYHDGLA
jgi:hypothetical protein